MATLESANETLEKVYKLYVTSIYTQEDIAKKLNISIEAVRWCTRFFGYKHTKAKDGKKVMWRIDDAEPLRKLLD